MNAFQHRRPLIFYLHEQNPETLIPVSPWFVRARWFCIGLGCAGLLFVVMS